MITIISAVAIGLADYSLQLPGPYSQLLMTGGGVVLLNVLIIGLMVYLELMTNSHVEFLLKFSVNRVK